VINAHATPTSQMLNEVRCDTGTHNWYQVSDHGNGPIGDPTSRTYSLHYKCSKCNFLNVHFDNNIKAKPPKNLPAGTACGSNHNYVFVEGHAKYTCGVCRRTERVTFGAAAVQSGKAPLPPLKTCPTKHKFKTTPEKQATYAHKCSACAKSVTDLNKTTGPNTTDCPKGPHAWVADNSGPNIQVPNAGPGVVLPGQAQMR
jgi:DNA-directed RNA polymerase subunit RPC12/RpoP